MMRRYLVVLAGGVSIIIAATAVLAKPSRSEIVVALSAVLKPEWTELHAKTALQTTSELSEVFIEIPGLHAGQGGGPPLVKDDKELSVEGYLIANSGERIRLDEVEIMSFGNRPVLRLSNRRL